MTFPFMKITKQSNFTLNFKFDCNETYSTIKQCAEICYHKEKSTVGCVGFLTKMETKNCHLCRPANLTEIQSSDFTQINADDIIHLLKRHEKPDIYLPLEPENRTGSNIMGDGVTGTLGSPSNVLARNGKVKQGLHVANGGDIRLRTDCLNNMATCGNMLTLMVWINPTWLIAESGHLTYSANSINIMHLSTGGIGTYVINNAFILHGAAVSAAPVNVWTRVAVAYDQKVGLWVYINGVLEGFNPISLANSATAPADNPFYIGSKMGENHHRYAGVLDEIKFFYKGLNSAGE